MSRLWLGLALAVGLLAAPGELGASGGGGGHGKSPGGGGSGGDAPKAATPTDPRAVDVPVVVAPVVGGGGLEAYLYLDIRLEASDAREADRLKTELPLIQDAVLRALHAYPFDAAAAEGEGAMTRAVGIIGDALTGLFGPGHVNRVVVRSMVRVPV